MCFTSAVHVLAIIVIMSMRDNVWQILSMWDCILRYLGSPFLWHPDRSFQRSLFAFWFAYTQPWSNGSFFTGLMRPGDFHLDPSLQVVLKPDDICRFSSCLPLCLTWGPWLPHLPPGPVQCNLIQQYLQSAAICQARRWSWSYKEK